MQPPPLAPMPEGRPPASDHEPATVDRAGAHRAILILFSLVIAGISLGGRGLPNFDDCFYSVKAREILLTGDWITLHYNGLPEFQHPPLFVWLQALGYAAFGVHDWVARLPSVIATLLCVWIVYRFGRSLFGEWAGFAAALTLATSAPFIKVARHALMDNLVALLMLGALVSGWLGASGRRRWYLAHGLFLGLGLLTKSLLGIFPVIVLSLWLLGTRRGRDLASPSFLWGLALAAGIASIWFVPQLVLHGQAFVDSHFGFLIFGQAMRSPGAIAGWTDRFDYFLDLVKNYWPWFPVLAVAWAGLARRAVEGGKDQAIALLLLLWAWVPLLLLTAADEHFIRFMMPIYPALALTVGWQLSGWLGAAGRRRLTLGATALAAIGALALIVRPAAVTADWSIDMRAMAPQISERHAPLARYRLLYHHLNNSLLYYSGRVAEQNLETPEEALRWLSEPTSGDLILRAGDYGPAIVEPGVEHRVLFRGEEWVWVTGPGEDGGSAKTPHWFGALTQE